MNVVEKNFEKLLFRTRWLLAPFYVGLVISVVLLLIKFYEEMVHVILHLFQLSEGELIIAILSLIDMSLIANLLIIITFSGYESFVSKIDLEDHEDKPAWIGKMGFSALKMKVIGSIVAISAIEMLKVFINVDSYTEVQLFWKVTIHLSFVLSGVLFAVMDRLSTSSH